MKKTNTNNSTKTYYYPPRTVEEFFDAINLEKGDEVYIFAINGQTGRLTCDVPADKKKAFAWGAGVFAGVFGVAALALYLTEYLGSGTLLFAVIAALIAALAVVGGMKAQLKQAVHQNAAADYVRENSFDLDVHYDKFLYETTKKRKIETNQQKK